LFGKEGDVEKESEEREGLLRWGGETPALWGPYHPFRGRTHESSLLSADCLPIEKKVPGGQKKEVLEQKNTYESPDGQLEKISSGKNQPPRREETTGEGGGGGGSGGDLSLTFKEGKDGWGKRPLSIARKETHRGKG